MVATSPATVPAAALADVLARARKVLLHEQRTGYLDRAAVGGLERFVRQLRPVGSDRAAAAWLSAAAGALEEYGTKSPSTRQEVVARLLRELDQPAAGVAPPEASAPRAAAKSGAAPESAEQRAARPVAPVSPQAAVGELPGLGPRAVAALARLGVHSVRDLLYHFPRRHLDRRAMTPLAALAPGGETTVFATVYQVQTRRHGGHGLAVTDAVLQDESGFCHAVWFNQPYLVRTLSRPGRIVFSGRVESGPDGALQLVSPEFEFDSEDLLHTGRLVPFYPKTEGVSDKQIRTWVRLALGAALAQVRDPLPPDVVAGAGLPALPAAITAAHFPEDDADLAAARRRLAFDELLLIQLGVLRRRREWQEGEPGISLPAGEGVLEDFTALLPFELTAAQHRVIGEIMGDMSRPLPMSRLLQGDVGSGKTVVAASGHPGGGAQRLPGGPDGPDRGAGRAAPPHRHPPARPLRPERRPGQREPAPGGEAARLERERRRGDRRAGRHPRADPGRRGVQGPRPGGGGRAAPLRRPATGRAAGQGRPPGPAGDDGDAHPAHPGAHPLRRSGRVRDRRAAAGAAGDQDLPVSTEHRHRAYDFLRKQVRAGRQGFIICPLVEESEKVEARAATAEYERLQRQFPDLRLALLHGELPPKEKEQVMVAFRDGYVDVLVSTAVVEVGIDIPNATVMLIEGADRFGLAQLHQFRGRVGRGEHQSYCLLLSDSAGAEQNARLRAVVENQDGFALAEEDLELRGPGEFFGTRQSGLPDLKVARLTDLAILELARRVAQQLDAADPGLGQPEHALLRASVEAFWGRAETAA